MTETAYDRVISALDQAGCKVRTSGGRVQAQCPGHADRHPSLSVTGITGSVLIYCHAGCHVDDVVDALGLTKADLFDDRKGATYSYPGGRRVHRFPDKSFRQSGDTKDRSLFRQDRVSAAVLAGERVFVVEGEKDVLAIESVGGTATCSPMGAGKWSRVDPTPLNGATVSVVADKDDPGRKHAAEVAASLTGLAASVIVVKAAVGKDAADHIAAGHSLNSFVAADRSSPPAADRTMMARKASTLPVPKPVTWLAVGWLPLFAVIVLVGDEGIGKSLFWVYVVACVTTGRALPQIGLPARGARDVIIVITEDSWSEVRARLVLAGADLDRIHLISEEDDGSGSPIFPVDMDVVTDLADEIKPAMIVLDSWLDTVASGMSIKDPQQARTALHPWKEVAQRYACSVLLLTHTNRQQDASTRDRMGGTGALRQKARMVLFAAAEAEGVGAQLFIGPDKANSTARANAVRFNLTVEQVRPVTIDDPGTVPVLARPVEQDKRIGVLIDQWRTEEKEAKKPPSADQRAEAWLRDYMKAHRGKADAATTQTAGQAAGHTSRRITEVLKAMGGVSKPAGAGRPWVYLYPAPVLSVLPDLPPVRDMDGTDKTAAQPVLPGLPDSPTESRTDKTEKTESGDPS